MIRRLLFILSLTVLVVSLTSCSYLLSLRKAPLEGTVRIYDDNRRLERVVHYENGRLQGLCEGYFPSGAVEWQAHYDDGKKTGIQRIYFENGRMRSETPFIKGHIHGIVTVYDEAGHLIMEIPVKNDKISGEVLRYRYDDGSSGYQAPMRMDSPAYRKATKTVAPPSDEEVQETMAYVSKRANAAAINVATEEDEEVDPETTVDEDSTAYDQPVKEKNKEVVANNNEVGETGNSFWDEFGNITGKYTKKATTSPVAFVRDLISRPQERTYSRDNAYASRDTSEPRIDSDGEVRYRVGTASRDSVDAPSELPAPKSNPQFTTTRKTINGISAHDAVRNLPSETNSYALLTKNVTSSNVRRATENSIVRDYLQGDANADDPDALARERVIAQMDKKKTQTLKTTASGMEIYYRQTSSGNEYIVYPKGGSRDNEAWKYQMLKNGKDYNDAVKQGLN